jgi:hypothetical protein
MQKTSINNIVFILLSVFIFVSEGCYSLEEKMGDYLPIEDCTEGKSVDRFLSEFKLEKVNRIVFKDVLDEYPVKTRTLTTITDIEKIRWFISTFKKIQCMVYCLCDSIYEFWLYENNNLLLKVSFHPEHSGTVVVKFYEPGKQPGIDRKIGSGADFYIEDNGLSSWLFVLMDKYGIKETD